MRGLNWGLIGAACLVVIAAGWWFAYPSATEEPARHRAGFSRLNPPVAFDGLSLVDGAGHPADIGRYRGKALLVNLWATWCAPCIAELPSIAALNSQLESPSFAVLPIAIDERDPAKVAAFLKQHQISLPALVDVGRSVARIVKVTAIPTSLLIGRDGMAKAIFIGDTRWDCGRPLEVVREFAVSETVSEEVLAPCE